MSNKRKLRQPSMFDRRKRGVEDKLISGTIINPSGMEKVTIPKSEKVVIKTVPAKADGEEIGTAFIYEDGTFDIAVNEGISETAKAHVYSFKQMMVDDYGLADGGMEITQEESHGVPE